MFQEIFNVTGITSFAGGDILKIDDEYLILNEVGIAGSTKFGVENFNLVLHLGSTQLGNDY